MARSGGAVQEQMFKASGNAVEQTVSSSSNFEAGDGGVLRKVEAALVL